MNAKYIYITLHERILDLNLKSKMRNEIDCSVDTSGIKYQFIFPLKNKISTNAGLIPSTNRHRIISILRLNIRYALCYTMFAKSHRNLTVNKSKEKPGATDGVLLTI